MHIGAWAVIGNETTIEYMAWFQSRSRPKLVDTEIFSHQPVSNELVDEGIVSFIFTHIC